MSNQKWQAFKLFQTVANNFFNDTVHGRKVVAESQWNKTKKGVLPSAMQIFIADGRVYTQPSTRLHLDQVTEEGLSTRESGGYEVSDFKHHSAHSPTHPEKGRRKECWGKQT